MTWDFEDAYEAHYYDKGWKLESCGRCLGFGTVSVYSARDFEGPGDCPSCGGNAIIWRTPTGRYVLYPGGPFV